MEIEKATLLIFDSTRSGNTFEGMLEESSYAFNYWRYVYEKTCAETSPQLLRVLRLTLEGMARRMRSAKVDESCGNS